MNRKDKEQKVEQYEEAVGVANYAFLCDYNKVSVADYEKMRTKFAEMGAGVVVMKNTLARIVFERHGLQEVAEYLAGPSVLIYGSGEEISPVAKHLEKTMRQLRNNISVKAVLYDGSIFPKEHFKSFTTLPTRDEVRAKLLGVLQAPLGNFLRVNTAAQRLVSVLQQYADKAA
jgi:large subunit ribosomal protein L10